MRVFSDSEMQRRQEKAVRALNDRAVDIAILHTEDNVYYMSGVPLLSAWGRPMWMVIHPSGRTALAGSKGEKLNNERNGYVREVHAYGDEEKSTAACLNIVCGLVRRWAPQVRRIGLELGLIPHGLYAELVREFPDAAFVDIADVLAELRIIKSDEELKLLQLGGTIAKLGADAFIEALAPNATELAVAAHAVEAMDVALGALHPSGHSSSFAYCHFGDHTMTPHLHPTGRRLQGSNIVALNVFPVVSGYLMELERTLIFGPASDAQASALETMELAFKTAKECARPGMRASALDAVAREIIREAGYIEHVRSGTGHAHGIMIGAGGREELGELRSYNDRILEANMIFSIEPAFYIAELGGGFRHSDVMLLTNDGARCVTEFPTRFTY